MKRSISPVVRKVVDPVQHVIGGFIIDDKIVDCKNEECLNGWSPVQ